MLRFYSSDNISTTLALEAKIKNEIQNAKLDANTSNKMMLTRVFTAMTFLYSMLEKACSSLTSISVCLQNNKLELKDTY